MITITVTEEEDYWECGDGCCSYFETITVFQHNGESYEYRSHDSIVNYKTFMEDVLGVKFEDSQ